MRIFTGFYLHDQLFPFLFGFLGALVGQFSTAYRAWVSSGSLPHYFKTWVYWVVTLGIGAVAGALTLSFYVTVPSIALLVGFAVPQLLKGFAQIPPPGESKAREKLERAERAIEREPEKSRPYWDASSARLEVYFQRNLSQTQSIFWITVAVLLAGFGLICYGVVHAFNGASIEASVLTAASGVVTEFIAATFLVIYRSTTSQASEFVTALERINAVGMALQIVDSISTEAQELRNKTRAELAIKILAVFSAGSAKKQPADKSKKKKDESAEER
jgi:hypothetical protein